MRGNRVRRAMAAALIAAAFGAGCSQGNDIPLVQFPEGKAPPPAPTKSEPASQGANTSKGEPVH